MKKPNLNSWKMLDIKTGTNLYRKADSKSICKTVSDETMEVELRIDKEKIRKQGLVKAEEHMRNLEGNPKKRHDGWDYWGIKDKDGNWNSILKIYSETERDVLVERS